MIKKILILDDNVEITRILTGMLLDANYPYVTAANTIRDAKKHLDSDTDLVLVDLVLYKDPDNESGEDFIQWVKQYNRNCWIILMTGHEELIEKFRSSDVDEVIAKTGKMSDIVDIVNKYNILALRNDLDENAKHDIRMLKIELSRIRGDLQEDRHKIENFDFRITSMEKLVNTLSSEVSTFIRKHEKDAIKIILAFAAILATLFGISITVGIVLFNHLINIIQKVPH